MLRNVVGACYDCQRVSLESNLQDLDAIRTEAESILQNLSDAQVNESPGEGRWSVGQCFSHEPFRYSVIESWFVRKMDVQSKMKFKAPKIYAPATELTRRRNSSAISSHCKIDGSRASRMLTGCILERFAYQHL